jgi:hypothetical protein
MQVASLELCQELYEVSGWVNDAHWIEQGPNEFLASRDNYPTVAVHDDAMGEYPYFKKKLSPAYDLGYLLRKLPKFIGNDRVTIQPVVDDRWDASYDEIDGSSTHDCFADTPEDAAAKLAIQLFNQHILRKEPTK